MTPSIIVTGATGGIGKATVAELVKRGTNVLAVDLNAERLDALAEQVGRDAILTRVADAADAATVKGLVDTAVKEFGRLDGIFNNAGILGPLIDVVKYDLADFERVYRTNVLSVFLGMKYALPAIRASGGGSILNTASTGAMIGAAGLTGYVSSKHAVLGLSRCVAVEVAKEPIRVNTLAPGATDTPMMSNFFDGIGTPDASAVQQAIDIVTPTGRMAYPEEIASVATWLLLDAPVYLTGAIIPVDGAQTTR